MAGRELEGLGEGDILSASKCKIIMPNKKWIIADLRDIGIKVSRKDAKRFSITFAASREETVNPPKGVVSR
jgi:hypothetical protein